MSELLLVRHCESSGQRPDAPLTEKGFEQARSLSEFLVSLEPDRIFCSPFRRARQTIAPFAARSGFPLHTEPRLSERELSAEPLDDWLEQLRKTWEDFDYRAPGGETSREAQRRGRQAFNEIAAAGHRCAILVSHGNLLGLLMNSIDPSFDFDRWGALTNPDVFRVRVQARGSGREIERLWVDP